MAAVASLLLTAAGGAAFGQAGPSAAEIGAVFSGLEAGETAKLSAGNPVLRVSDRAKNLALAGDAGQAADIKGRFAKLGPNYFGEFLYVRRFDPSLLEKLRTYLADPRHFIGIPYYSQRNKATYSLFDRMDVKETKSQGDLAIVLVSQHMEPFDDYEATYSLRRIDGGLVFTFVNDEPIVYNYRHFKAAGPGGMAWSLYAFEKDGWFWMYGAGGVRAFDLFGAFRDRLEDSFLGRIEAFFTSAMKAAGN